MLSRGEFTELVLEPGRVLKLTSSLHVPGNIEGVDIAGDPLDVMVDSIHPLDLEYIGASVFRDAHPEVAPGPSMVRVVPSLEAGDNGPLTLKVNPLPYKTWPWLRLRFSTPGLRRSFERMDVAWAQLALAAEVASGSREEAEVEQASRLVMKMNLERPGDPALAPGIAEMAAALETVGDRIRKLKVHVIGHSHIDMNWLWTWPDTFEVIKRDFATILALMDEFPEMTFTHSQAATYEVIRQERPALFAKVREHVAAGRWELATMQWVESDLNMVSGESLAHQKLEGVGYAREHFGRGPSVFLAPDTFGHGGNVPQFVQSAGARFYYHHRCNPGGHDLWPAYWWQGDDGTRVLALSTPSYNGLITAGAIAQAALRSHRRGLSTSLLFHGVGDHGGGPTREGLEALRRFASQPCLPASRCSTISAHGEEVLAAKAELPVHAGELNTIFEGCYTTHSDAKAHNRHAESLLTTAETVAALAALDERDVLSDAWRQVLFNQFHDIFCGSSIHEAYEKNHSDMVAAESSATSVIDKALSVLEGKIESDIAVTNPLGWDRDDVVVVALDRTDSRPVTLLSDGGESTPGQWTDGGLAFVARVPALGTAGYVVRPAPDANREIAIDAGPLYIAVETESFAARIHRPSGAIVSLVDKRVGRELVGFGTKRGSDYLDVARVDLALNVLQVLDERFHPMSAWHFDEVNTETSLIDGATTEVVETGPVRAVISSKRSFRQSHIEQRMVFYARMPRIDFETSIDWQERGGPEHGIPDLKVAFNARLPEIEAWYETPFGAARRPADGQEVPGLRWADVGGEDYGVALLNDVRYGHDALGGRLRLTLLRSAFDPDPVSDVGQHVMRYSLVPHSGDWREAGVTRLAASFNQPLIGRAAPKKKTGKSLTWRPRHAGSDGVLLSAMKLRHRGPGLVLRLQESFGKKGEAVIDGAPAGWHAHMATVTEELLDEIPVSGGRFQLALGPWQVATVVMTAPA